MTKENSELLLDKMSKAYSDHEVEKIPELQKILLKYASKLNEDVSYIQVVTGLLLLSQYLAHVFLDTCSDSFSVEPINII